MDWLQFTAAIIGHLAWPLVILILLIMVRKQIHSLAERLLEFSFGGAKMTFDKILQKGAEIIEQSPLPEPPNSTEEPQLKLEPATDEAKSNEHDVEKLKLTARARLKASARGQIYLGFEEVNSILDEIGSYLGYGKSKKVSGQIIASSLLRSGAISKDIYDLYIALREARNLVVHAKSFPSEDEALEYVRQAEFLKATFLQIKHKAGRGFIKIT